MCSKCQVVIICRASEKVIRFSYILCKVKTSELCFCAIRSLVGGGLSVHGCPAESAWVC